jgi:RHS repeat-associated protein
VPSFYGYDGSGSVRQLTSYATGQITDTDDYDAFGNKVNSTGTTPNNYLYRGEQYDPDLGLYYLRARYYNPVTGRFLNVDSFAGQGQRRYEYAAADPVNGADPSGNFVLESYWPLHAPLQIHIPLPSWCAQTAGNSMHKDLPPCTPPCKKCGLKKAPEYDKGPVITGGTEFSWGATFLNDSTHKPTCCEVHQMVSWSNGPAPWWFFPPENRPNTWYEDRDPLNRRYGRRDLSTSIGSHLTSWSNVYFGDQYRGDDRPANWPHGEKFRFKLIVVDVCPGNNNAIIYTSKVLHDNF